VARDTFNACIMWGEGGTWRRLKDTDYTRLRAVLERRGFKPIGTDMMRQTVEQHAEDHAFDSAIQWADGLAWDGIPRAERFLADYFGVKDSPYAGAVSLYMWTALAGRCLVPGCKADMVPVLIGAQGVGKTTAVMALAPTPETFVEIDLTRKPDDTSRMLGGRLVGEIAELKGLRGRDSEAIKAFITSTHEEWVEKWDKLPTRVGRRLLMIGTGNNAEFLDDETGERRWLPVTVGSVDVPGIEAAREQLWAEGIARFRETGVAWYDAQRLAAAEHSKFKVIDPWYPLIEEWLERDAMDGESGEKRGDAPFRLIDVCHHALGMVADKVNRAAEMRVGGVLRHLGYSKERVMVAGVQSRLWSKSRTLADLCPPVPTLEA
jgi:predicted P-loop ATPase